MLQILLKHSKNGRINHGQHKECPIVVIDKIEIDGIVTDENDQPYDGATVILDVYFSNETTTDADGKYSFEAYKGQSYTITTQAKEDKYETANADVIAPSNAYTCTTLKFNIKEFTITTSAGQNASVTPTNQVKYDEDFSVTAKTDTDYRIAEFKVDDQAVNEATREETYTYDFKNVTDAHKAENEWTVVAPYDTANNQSGTITVNNDKSVTGDIGWTQTKVEANLVTELQKIITVNNNSNSIVVHVKMTDRAGNTSQKNSKTQKTQKRYKPLDFSTKLC